MRALLTVGWIVLASAVAAPALASKIEKSERLINLHDLKTTVAIGDYYLKQESLQAARAYLNRVGREQNLGAAWNSSNPHWQQAEAALVRNLTRQVNHGFSSMEWLSQEWGELNNAELSEQDMDLLLEHFGTDVGRKQVMIVDHSVAFHVMAALSLAGKIRENVPGSETERKRMQDLYNDEDLAMRFNSNDNPEGTQFAFSPVGKKYFVNAVLKVSGLISRRLYQIAAQMPALVAVEADVAMPAVEAFRKAQSS